MAIRERSTVRGLPWGRGCRAWLLTDCAGLSVKLEEMPPGTEELRHRHARARQVFFVLSGVLEMELAGTVYHLGKEQALEVPPGAPHQARNAGSVALRFLLISTPTTDGDREEVAR